MCRSGYQISPMCDSHGYASKDMNVYSLNSSLQTFWHNTGETSAYTHRFLVMEHDRFKNACIDGYFANDNVLSNHQGTEIDDHVNYSPHFFLIMLHKEAFRYYGNSFPNLFGNCFRHTCSIIRLPILIYQVRSCSSCC